MLFADFSTGYLFYGVDISSVAGVLDEPFQLTPLSGVAVHARQATQAGTVSILRSLAVAVRYSYFSYSAEPAYLSKVRLKLSLLVQNFQRPVKLAQTTKCIGQTSILLRGFSLAYNRVSITNKVDLLNIKKLSVLAIIKLFIVHWTPYNFHWQFLQF